MGISREVLSWEEVYGLSGEDAQIRKVISVLNAGIKDWEMCAPELPWFAHRGGLVGLDCALLFKGQVVVSAVGWEAMLAGLHQAHQGQTNMPARAMESVWWPGLSKDITATRAACPKCTQEAPCQPRDWPEPIQEPDYVTRSSPQTTSRSGECSTLSSWTGTPAGLWCTGP